MRVPPSGIGGRLALGIRAAIMLGIAGFGTAAVVRTAGGDAFPLSLLLVLSVPGVYGVATVASIVLAGSDDEALARLERRGRGLSVAWGFLAIAGLLLLQGSGSVSLARPGSVLVAALFLSVFGGTGAFIGAGFVIGGERGRLALLLGLSCFWTPLFAGFALALLAGTPYYWLVMTEPSLAKALGAGALAVVGLGIGWIAVVPAKMALSKWRELGGLRA